MNGTAEFGLGLQIIGHGKELYIQWTQMLFITANLFGSRLPIRVSEFNNLVLPFAPLVWAGVLACLLAVSVALWLIYRAYRAEEALADPMIKRPVKLGMDFAIYPLAAMIEPFEIPWFQVGSAGTWM